MIRLLVGRLVKGFFFIPATSHFLTDLLAQQAGGLTSSTMISTANTIALDSWVEKYAPGKDLDHAQQQAAQQRPGIEPIPPNTAAVNALMPGMDPVVGTSVGIGRTEQHPASRQSGADGKGHGDRQVHIDAHQLRRPLSSEQARMALPIFSAAGKPVRSA